MLSHAAKTNTLTLFEGMSISNGMEESKAARGSEQWISKIITRRKQNTMERNERIVKQFNHKYNVERKRYDDVIAELCKEFSLAKSTIENVIKS